MPALTRRRDLDAHGECWRVYFGDVHVGTIARRVGNPVDTDAWQWRSGFYPGVEPPGHQSGTARTFEAARAAFRKAWRELLPTLCEADFQRWRDQRDFTSWKYRMHDCGCRMPTQNSDGRSRCFCGETIAIGDTMRHVYAAHRAA
jgi:hypothetical protein